MNRKEIDEAILNAIAILKQENRPLTPVNIQDVSDVKLRLYQIYNSKLKGQLEIRGKADDRVDDAILKAIGILKKQGKRITTLNIQEVSEPKLRLPQIYKSKHIDQIEIRGTNQRLEKLRKERSLLSPVDTPVDAEILQAEKDKLMEKSLGERYLIVERPSPDNKRNKVSIDLNYTIGDTRMIIIRNDADSDDLEEMIEDATFILKKFIERIKREQANLSK